ncbi:MAG TPA: aminodeoxychorismate synthase component I [Vicinamibacteria bacterium]|nr:aminodeoxychorismate synthase component I [Vicinamibacteria bacterium]
MGSILVQELPGAPEPADACARFLDAPYPLLLESAARSGDLGRHSFLAADPWEVLRHGAREAFPALERALARHRLEPLPELPPFQGGAAGFLSYDLCHAIERLPSPRHDDLELPDLCLGLYDWTLAWDHARGRCWLFSTGLPEEGGAARARAAARAAWVRRRLAFPAAMTSATLPAPPRPAGPPTYDVAELPGVRSTFSREGFLAAVARTREYVLAGDIFQANLSQRLEAPLRDHPFALYARLRARNAAPFAAYFDFGEAAAVSASPERFLRAAGGCVETRPIKGTSPRGFNPRHDSALGEALYESEKDRAENVMIVDLLRNDLSKVCEDGSVEVPELCRIERYATVHHLVSTVVGRLRSELGPVDLLRATWPGGSITGAPKVRAMEIIAELEPTRRGLYTGSLGYFSFSGALDLSIAIRTFVVRSGRACFQAGAGIVADSDPEREYDETLQKALGMAGAL